MPRLAINNIHLYYEMHGTKAPLLFIHGLGASTQDWEYQRDVFAKNYQVILVDLRGHGQSDKPNMPYSIPLFAQDIAQLLKTLALFPTHVVGHSLGGMVALQLVLDFPELVKSLTLVNSAPMVSFPSLGSRVGFYLRTLNVKLFGMRFLSMQLAKMLFPKPEQASLRDTFIERWCQNDPQAYLNALAAFSDWNVMARLYQLKAPTLVVSADQDYTPVAFKQFYLKMIPQAELVIIPDSRHITIIDQAVAFNQALADFLKDK